MQGKAKLDKFRYYEGKKYIKVVREEYDETNDRWRDTTVHAFIDRKTGDVYKPSGNTLTPFLRITISKMVDVRFVPQCSIHKKDRIKISFSFAVIFVIYYLIYRYPPAHPTHLGSVRNNKSFLSQKLNLTCFAGAFQDAGLKTSPVFLSTNA